MEHPEQDRLLEIYKVHTELADRVTQRRKGANRLYVSLHVGLAVFLAAVLRFGIGDTPGHLVLGLIGALGILLAVSWSVVIRSYRQLNTEKFRVLHDLEQQLPYQFFTLEWDPETKGEKTNRYWKLTYAELTLPLIFFTLWTAVIVYLIFV